MKNLIILFVITFTLVSFNYATNDEKRCHFDPTQAEEIFPGSQGAKDDKSKGLEVLNNCINNYLALSRFKMDVEYSVFYNNQSDFSIPDDKESGKVICKNKNYYQEEMGNIKILNDKYELYIIKESEVLTISPRKREDLAPVNFELDSISSQIEKVDKIESGYRFYIKSGQIEKFDLVVDNSGFLTKFRNYYRQKMDFGDGEVQVVTQLRYYNFSENPKIDSDVFSIDKYVHVDKTGKVTPIGKYKNYYVLNQIPQK